MRAWFVLLLTAGMALAGIPQDLERAAEFERLGDFESALAIFERIYGQAPANPQAILGLKRNYARLGKRSALLALQRGLLARAPENTSLALELADMLLPDQDMKAVADSLLQASVERDGSEEGYARAARVYVKHGKWDDALRMYLGYRKRTGENGAFIQETAEACRRLERYRDMAAEYMKLTANLDQDGYTLLSGLLEGTAGNAGAYGAVVEALGGVIENTPEDQRYLLHKLERDLHMLAGNGDAAFTAVRAMEAVSPRNGKDLHGFAEWCRNEGLLRMAMRADAYLVTAAPESPYVPDAYFNRAMSAIALGDFGRGRAFLDTLIDRYDRHKLAPRARYELGELLFRHLQRPGEAITQYAQVVKKYPRSDLAVDALFRTGDCLVAAGNLAKAARQFEDLAIRARGNSENVNRALFSRAEVLLMQGNFDEARKIIAGLADAKGSMYRNDALDMQILLQEDDGVLKAYARALSAERRFDFPAARDAWKAMLAGNTGGLAGRVRLNLAIAYAACGDPAGAAGAYRAFLTELPDDPQAPLAGYRLGMLLEDELNDAAAARESYTDVLRRYADSPVAPRARFRLRRLE